MIPDIFVEMWSKSVSWQTLSMVEQDLLLSRVIINLYSDDHIKESLVFRGGTALNKIYLTPPARYSEDLDFVQRNKEPIGFTIDRIKQILFPLFGEPKWKVTERGVKIVYQYSSVTGLPSKIKIEINTTEHFHVLPIKNVLFSINSEWFSDSVTLPTYEFTELMGTKLRALYQRRKGRDLFDLWYTVNHCQLNIVDIIDIFSRYCKNDGIKISKEIFKKNLETKKLNTDFQKDMDVLLPNQTYWNFQEAFDFVQNKIIGLIP
jgi:predicted nucleotidyltransferase component of viral defense system